MSFFSIAFGFHLGKEAKGIHRLTTIADLKMEMGTCGTAGGTYTGNLLTLPNEIPFPNRILFVVGIDRRPPTFMADDDHISVATDAIVAVDHFSFFGSPNRRSLGCINVYSFMGIVPSRMKTTHNRSDHWPDQAKGGVFPSLNRFWF